MLVPDADVVEQALIAGYALEVSILSDVECHLDASVIELGLSYANCLTSFVTSMMTIWNDASSRNCGRIVDEHREQLRATLLTNTQGTPVSALLTIRGVTVHYTLNGEEALQVRASLRQPYALLQLDHLSQRFELSFHDAAFAHTCRQGPQLPWLVSRSGRKHPNTGVPASLCHATMTNCSSRGAAPSASLHLERPLCITVCAERLRVALLCASELRRLFQSSQLLFVIFLRVKGTV